MSAKTALFQILILSFASAANAAPSLDKRAVIQELLQKIEAIDPNIKSHADQFAKVRTELERAAQMSESAQGLKLSVQHILDQWGGVNFRVLSPEDAAYWAATGKPLTLPKAWFKLRGSRWVVTASRDPNLRRGDSFLSKDAAPFAAPLQGQTSWTLPIQSTTGAETKPVTVKADSKPLADWSFELSQSSSDVGIIENKRVCFEKIWFQIDRPLSEMLSSKLASGQCQAMMIDLRDVSGPGSESWRAPKAKLPIAVLSNAETSQGAVRLLRSLRKDMSARVFGETTATDRLSERQETLTKIDWVIRASGDGGQETPDQAIRDSSLYAAGVDDVKEAGLDWIKKQLGG